MADFQPKINGPISGQSWQYAPRTMPYDRPAQFSDLNQALQWVFKRLAQPPITKSLLNILDAGYPIDMLVSGMMLQFFQEGRIGAPIIAQCVGPVTVMLWRMAESAGVNPQLATDKNAKMNFDPVDIHAAQARISNNTMDKAIGGNEKSQKELNSSKLVDKQAFLKARPKKILGGM